MRRNRSFIIILRCAQVGLHKCITNLNTSYKKSCHGLAYHLPGQHSDALTRMTGQSRGTLGSKKACQTYFIGQRAVTRETDATHSMLQYGKTHASKLFGHIWLTRVMAPRLPEKSEPDHPETDRLGRTKGAAAVLRSSEERLLPGSLRSAVYIALLEPSSIIHIVTTCSPIQRGVVQEHSGNYAMHLRQTIICNFISPYIKLATRRCSASQV